MRSLDMSFIVLVTRFSSHAFWASLAFLRTCLLVFLPSMEKYFLINIASAREMSKTALQQSEHPFLHLNSLGCFFATVATTLSICLNSCFNSFSITVKTC